MESNEIIVRIIVDCAAFAIGFITSMLAFKFALDRNDAVHKREIAELRERLRLSSNAMEMVVQWLDRYPEWQRCLKNGVARNRQALEGGKDGK